MREVNKVEYPEKRSADEVRRGLRREMLKLRIRRLVAPGLSTEKKVEMLREEARLMGAIEQCRHKTTYADGIETPERFL